MKRALAARRRLALLAPALFDTASIAQHDRQCADRAFREREIVEAIAKAYKVSVEEAFSASPFQQNFHPEKGEEKVKRWFAEFNLLPMPVRYEMVELMALEEAEMEQGRQALERFRRTRPHTTASLLQIAALLEIASDLGRMASGIKFTP